MVHGDRERGSGSVRLALGSLLCRLHHGGDEVDIGLGPTSTDDRPG
jgi:hypothetical protein